MVAAVRADSGAKADTTAPGAVPPLVSSTAPAKGRLEWISGTIFRATLDYERDQLSVYLEGDTFWKPSQGGANPVAFTSDSTALSAFTWPGNTERLLKGTTWATVESQDSGRVVLFLGGSAVFAASGAGRRGSCRMRFWWGRAGSCCPLGCATRAPAWRLMAKS
jgi:hypothetical protein